MAYKYFLSGSPITFYSPNESFVNDFNAYLTAEFANASNVYTIQKESSFASGSYVPIQVRINTAIDSETGQKLGDDFKVILFKTLSDAGSMGSKYYFDDNYWLTINTEVTKNLAASLTVRRCNNVLRWTNSSGSQLSEHCIFDYRIASPKNTYRSDPLIPDGTIRLYCQLNSKTRQIKENQRFLFGSSGNFSAWRVYGAGILSFLNNETENNESAQIVEFAMGKSFINEDTDDLVGGYVDAYKILASGSTIENNIQITPTSGSILENDTQTYEVYLVSGSTILPNTFTFEISGSTTVVSTKYSFAAIDDNSFSVENISQDLDNSIFINCVSGSYLRVKELWLRGMW